MKEKGEIVLRNGLLCYSGYCTLGYVSISIRVLLALELFRLARTLFGGFYRVITIGRGLRQPFGLPMALTLIF